MYIVRVNDLDRIKFNDSGRVYKLSGRPHFGEGDECWGEFSVKVNDSITYLVEVKLCTLNLKVPFFRRRPFRDNRNRVVPALTLSVKVGNGKVIMKDKMVLLTRPDLVKNDLFRILFNPSNTVRVRGTSVVDGLGSVMDECVLYNYTISDSYGEYLKYHGIDYLLRDYREMTILDESNRIILK